MLKLKMLVVRFLMRYKVFVLFFSLGFGCCIVSEQAISHEYDNCATRLQNIQYELERARLSDNIHKHLGLKRALLNVRRYCHDESVEKGFDEVSKAKVAVFTRGEEMDDALEEGDPVKIEMARDNLHQARENLLQARRRSHD